MIIAETYHIKFISEIARLCPDWQKTTESRFMLLWLVVPICNCYRLAWRNRLAKFEFSDLVPFTLTQITLRNIWISPQWKEQLFLWAVDGNQSRMKIQNSKTYRPRPCDSNTMEAIQVSRPISDGSGKKEKKFIPKFIFIFTSYYFSE